jgi:hypothetical protein
MVPEVGTHYQRRPTIPSSTGMASYGRHALQPTTQVKAIVSQERPLPSHSTCITNNPLVRMYLRHNGLKAWLGAVQGTPHLTLGWPIAVRGMQAQALGAHPAD